MTEEQINRRFLWVCAVVWMIIIFLFSSQNALESGAMSGGIVDAIVAFILSFIHYLSETQIVKLQDFLEVFIRKSAHAINYLILAILIFKTQPSEKKESYKNLIALGVTLLYAITDEWHQFFVPGRSCELRDICVDFAGALVGIGIIFLNKRLEEKKLSKSIK